MAPNPLRAEHDAVLHGLSTRVSTHHFAHAAVSSLLAIALGATAVKLWVDLGAVNPEYSYASAIGCVLTVGYAAVRGALGARANTRERVQLTRLRALRLELGVDAPASLSHPS